MVDNQVGVVVGNQECVVLGRKVQFQCKMAGKFRQEVFDPGNPLVGTHSVDKPFLWPVTKVFHLFH